MTSVEQDVYGANLASSGKLKLRAKALLARGTSDAVFDACVLLHEAARKERCAIAALSVCPPVTLLTSTVEVCWSGRRARPTARCGSLGRRASRARRARATASRCHPRTLDFALFCAAAGLCADVGFLCNSVDPSRLGSSRRSRSGRPHPCPKRVGSAVAALSGSHCFSLARLQIGRSRRRQEGCLGCAGKGALARA